MALKDKERKNINAIKIAVAVIFGIASTSVIMEISGESQGVELLSSWVGYIVIISLCFALAYSTQYKKLKEEKKKETLSKEEFRKYQEEDEKYENLRKLRDKGILNDKEYQEKMQILHNFKVNDAIEESEDYIQLQSLYQSGILSQMEFNQKIDHLKKKQSDKSRDFQINVSRLSFKGYNKAQSIFKTAKEKNNTKAIEGLCKRMEEIFDIGRNTSAEDFISNLFITLEDQYEYKVTGEYKEDMVMIMDSEELYGFMNHNFDIVVFPQYEFAANFCEGFAVVRQERKFGYINSIGNVSIPIVYTDANCFSNQKAKVQIGKEKFFINKRGNRI